MIKKQRKCGFLQAVLLILLVVVVLTCVSCKKDGNDDDPQVQNTKIAELLKGKLDGYQIVRSETMNSGELKTVLAFLSAVQQNGYPDVQIVSDFVALDPIKDAEIIIGDTTRKGSVYNEVGEAVAQTDTYSIYIVEKRLIFTYTDSNGLVDGLEYLMFCSLDAEQATLTETYNLELFRRGIKRSVAEGFTLKNHISKGSVFSANDDLVFVGTAQPDSKITVQLTKNFDVLGSYDAITDANGTWMANVTPDTDADSVIIRVNGSLTERYEQLSFKKNEIDACSEGTEVYINGKQVDVYVNKGGNYVIASLPEGEQKMEIKLVRRETVNKCDVRPLSAGIEPKMSGKEITFTVTEFPCKLSVEFEEFLKDTKESVQLFLYPHEEFVPDLDGRDLWYFAPGEYWSNEKIHVPSNTTVYLEEGAVLHAIFELNHSENVTIMGRGIIDTYYFNGETRMMVFISCNNITLKDYTLIGPRRWMTELRESKNCVVDSLNILGTEINSDGVDIVGSQNVTVTNCFMRCNDDCIAIKSGISDVKNVTVKGCILWNERYGNGLEIGYETRCDEISNITFEDIDLIYVSGACMSIHLGDRAHVSNIKYKDIRIENSAGKLIDYFIKVTSYTKDDERGKISNVSFDGVVILGDSLGRISLAGFDASHNISDVSIGKIVFNGREMKDISNILEKNKYIKNIKYDGKSVG